MPDDTPKEIVLLALLGLSPALLTETLWALAQRTKDPVAPQRIVVLTTTAGVGKIRETLFANGTWNQFRTHFLKTFHLGEEYLQFGDISSAIRSFPSGNFQFELEDIRNGSEVKAVADYMMEIVAGLTANGNRRIIACVGGGRKSVGILLHGIFCLFGRQDDEVVHTLVEEPFDKCPSFLAPGFPAAVSHPETQESLSTTNVTLNCVSLPFIPLRYLFPESLKDIPTSYHELANRLREKSLLSKWDIEIDVDLVNGSISLNDEPLNLSPLLFAFYAYFLMRAKKGQEPLQTFHGLEKELVAFARSHHCQNHPHHWTHAVLEQSIDTSEDARKWASRLRKQLSEKGYEPALIRLLVPGRHCFAVQFPTSQISITT